MLVEREAAEAANTLHPEREGGGAAARTSPTPCGATAAAGGRCPSSQERMLARLARGGIQGLVNWGPRLSPERSASASQIAGMVAIQTQAIFTIERHDRKFPTRVLFRRTPSLIEGFALVSALDTPLAQRARHKNTHIRLQYVL